MTKSKLFIYSGFVLIALSIGAFVTAASDVPLPDVSLYSDEKLKNGEIVFLSDIEDREHFCVLRARFGTYRDFDEYLACKDFFSNTKALKESFK